MIDPDTGVAYDVKPDGTRVRRGYPQDARFWRFMFLLIPGRAWLELVAALFGYSLTINCRDERKPQG